MIDVDRARVGVRLSYARELLCALVWTTLDDCPNGEKKDTIIGAVPKAALVTVIEKYLDR